MAEPHWSFLKIEPGGTKRDPFEAEFFTGEDENDAGYARTDALVRESIQNALDARQEHTPPVPVRVRFAVSADSDVLPAESASRYLTGLVEHLDAVGNEVVNLNNPAPKMSFLVYEDFNTRGLCGDPARERDPAAGHTAREDFYWFWWNVGRSGKRGGDRGRWGLGKTVFHSTSRINTIFGLTVRETDGRQLLMGQSVTRMHSLGDEEYPPDSFFHDPEKTKPVRQPSEDPTVLDQFRKDFNITRKSEPGLSIVVPYRFDGIKASDLVQSAIIHWFVPILRGELIVEVTGPDLPTTVLTATSIRTVADSLAWTGKVSYKKHRPPPFDLADWAIGQQAKGAIPELKLAGSTTVPEWAEDLFDADLLATLRKGFAEKTRTALRVPMTVEKKVGGRIETHFDLFIEHVEELSKGEDHFVRAGMTISRISTLNSARGIRGLVIVDDETLSAFLGDAEGPAHEEWKTTERRPDKSYVKWQRRISFVKNSLSKVIAFLTPPPAGLDEDLLSEIFSIEDARQPGKKPGRGGKKGPRKEVPPPPPPPLLPAKPKWYRIARTTDGFRIRPSGKIAPVIGAQLNVALAYDLPDGNPLKNWSKFDFVIDGKATSPIKFRGNGVKVLANGTNGFTLKIEKTEFVLEVAGFDRVRDLYIRATDAAEQAGGGDDEPVQDQATDPGRVSTVSGGAP